MKKNLAYINGVFVDSEQNVEIKNPETNQVVGLVPSLSRQEIELAFQSARKAFKSWSQTSVEKRAKFLLEYASLLKEHAKPIATLMGEEIAKNFKESEVEVLRTVDYIVETVHEYLELEENPETYSYSCSITMPKNKIAFYKRTPLGVALTISPFNYPVNLMLAKIAPALLTGNTVVHKSATQGSLVGGYIAKLFDELKINGNEKLPPGVFNYVTGKGSVIGDILISNKEIDVASFTGSTEIGRKLASNMVMKPYILELGGKDPALVLDDADLQATAKEIVKGGFGFSGQRCTAIKRVFVSEKKADELSKLILENTLKLRVGLVKDGADITAVIDRNTVELLKRLYKDALEKGAKDLTNGLKITGNLVHPVLLDFVTKDMNVAWVEPFAPILPILRYKNVEDALALINESEYGLQGSIFTQDFELGKKLAEQMETGTVNINRASSRGPDILPFLGVKNSGYGLQGIVAALHSFTRPRGVVLNDDNPKA